VRAAAGCLHELDARPAARSVGRHEEDRLQLVVTRGAGEGPVVQVRVSYVAATEVPLAGVLLPDVTLSARAAMRGET
jgi:hypothetical protein